MTSTDSRLERERSGLLHHLERALEVPMIMLAIAWLALLIIELTRGLSSHLAHASQAIWVAFLADFVLKLAIAPRRLAYLRRNWLTVLSLVIPALRVGRLARIARALRMARGTRIVRVVSSLNRGLRSMRRLTRRRRLGFVLAVTTMVALTGAAGMMAFEREARPDGMFSSYGSALWWTAMILTTMGSDVSPRTAEGRLLCLGLALYSFTTFGYVTASLASHFVGQEDTERARRRDGSV